MSQRGGNTLSHGIDGRGNLNHAVGQNLNLHVFFECIAARPFQERGNAQTAPEALGFGGGFAFGKTLPVSRFQRFIHDHFKGARVVDLTHGVFVGHLFGFDKVFAAQFDAVNAAHAGSLVHQTFHVVDGFGAAGPAVSACAGGVGHDARKVVVNGLNVIHAALDPRPNEHLNGQAGHGGVGPHIGQGFDAQAHNFAVLGQGQRRFGLNVAAV